MIPSEIISAARKQTWVTTDMVSQPEAYTFLNFLLNDYWKDITDNNTGLGLNTWTYGLTAGIPTYTLPLPVANTTLLTSTFGIYQLTKIWVKLSSQDTDYTPVSLQYIEWYLNLPDYYSKAVSKSLPSCIADNTSITLFPTPPETVANWLQFIWPKSHFPLSMTTEDVEWVILIPSQRHYVLIEWLKYRFWGNLWVNFEDRRIQAKNFYESEKLRTLWQMQDRMQQSSESFVPDLSFLW